MKILIKTKLFFAEIIVRLFHVCPSCYTNKLIDFVEIDEMCNVCYNNKHDYNNNIIIKRILDVYKSDQ